MRSNNRSLLQKKFNGKLVVAVVNSPSKNIAGFPSEVLVLGISDNKGRVILLQPDKDAPLGSRVF